MQNNNLGCNEKHYKWTIFIMATKMSFKIEYVKATAHNYEKIDQKIRCEILWIFCQSNLSF